MEIEKMCNVSTQTEMTFPMEVEGKTITNGIGVARMPNTQFRKLYDFVHKAASNGDALTLFSILKPFLENESIVYTDPVIYNDEKHNHFHFTYRLTPVEVLMEILMDVRGFSDSKEGRYPPLIDAVYHGHNSVVEIILEHFNCPGLIEMTTSVYENDSTSASKIDDVTPLWLAIYKKHFQVILTLMKYGANINAKISNGSTPLRVACYNDDWEIVHELLVRGADPNAENIYGNTCLMLAAHMNSPNVVAEILLYDVDVNHQARCGSTALHFALEKMVVVNRQYDNTVFGMLVKKGARNMPNHAGVTPLMVAANSQALLSIDDSTDTQISIIEKFVGEHISEVADAWDAMCGKMLMDMNDPRIIEYSLRAFQLRERHNIPRCPLPPQPAYRSTVEVRSYEEFVGQLSGPSECFQGLLTRERIWGVDCPDLAEHRLIICDCLEYENRSSAAEKILRHGLIIAGRSKQISVFTYISQLTSIYSNTFTQIDFEDLNSVLDTCIDCLASFSEESSIVKLYRCYETPALKQTLKLMLIAHGMELTPEKDLELKRLVYRLCSINSIEETTASPLMLAIMYGINLINEPQYHVKAHDKMVTSMIECTNNVNARTAHGSGTIGGLTTLHSLAKIVADSEFVEDSRNVCHGHVLHLLEKGAHPDIRDEDGRIPADLCPESLTGQVLDLATCLNLQCTAARAVRKYNLEYEGIVSEHVRQFLDWH